MKIVRCLFIIVFLSGCAVFLPQLPTLKNGAAEPTLQPAAVTIYPVERATASPTGRVTDPHLLPTYTDGSPVTPTGRVTDPPLPAQKPTDQPTTRPTDQLTSDLLYISENRLMRWDHITGYTTLLVDGVVEYSAPVDYTGSSAGQKIALLRPRQISANGTEMFDLDLLDLQTKQTSHLLEETPRLYRLATSPDGTRVAYTRDEAGGLVEALDFSAPTQRMELGVCLSAGEIACQGVFWSPDSRSLLWSDAHGVWLAEVGYKQPGGPVRQVHPNLVQVTDPKGAVSQVAIRIVPLVWSPAGRFVLVVVYPQDSSVHWAAVLDTGAGRLVEVPNSFDVKEPAANLAWMQDGSLFMAHCGASAGVNNQALAASPKVIFWHLMPTHNELLAPYQVIDLNPTGQENPCPAWVAQRDSLSINFGWLTLPAMILANPVKQDSSGSTGATFASALYHLDLKTQIFSQDYVLPFAVADVLWSLDGAGALVLGEQSQIMFASFDGAGLLNLGAILGTEAHSFHWLPPAPRL